MSHDEGTCLPFVTPAMKLKAWFVRHWRDRYPENRPKHSGTGANRKKRRAKYSVKQEAYRCILETRERNPKTGKIDGKDHQLHATKGWRSYRRYE